LFSCGSLEVISNARNFDEVKKAREALPAGLPVFGCYNAGEIGPVALPQGSGTVVAVVIGSELRK